MKLIYTPIAALVLSSTLVVGNNANAAGWADRTSIGGFASSNFSATDSSVPYNGEKNVGHDNQGSFSSTRVGLTINSEINKRVRFAGQMFTAKAVDFDLIIDWAFAELAITDDLSLRAGKVKFPAGILNEYKDVGYAMPWITAPAVIYTELGAPNGPQMTRAGYTGGSLLGTRNVGDWALDADLFGGEINLEGAKVRTLIGFKTSANWDDVLLLQASAYEGTMRGTTNPMMEGAKHNGTMLGLKADWNNVIVYAEHAQITMGSLDNMKAVSWYGTLGYQMGKFLPHVTFQSFEQGKGAIDMNGNPDEDKQNTVTAGLRWDWLPGVALKAEFSQINTTEGVGLFPQGSAPPGKVNMVSFGIDTVF